MTDDLYLYSWDTCNCFHSQPKPSNCIETTSQHDQHLPLLQSLFVRMKKKHFDSILEVGDLMQFKSRE